MVFFDASHPNQKLNDVICILSQSNSIKCYVYFQKNVPTTFEVVPIYEEEIYEEHKRLKVTINIMNIVDQHMLPDTGNSIDITLTDEFLIADTLHINPGIFGLPQKPRADT